MIPLAKHREIIVSRISMPEKQNVSRYIYMYILYTDNICNYALEVFFWMMISPYFKNGGS